MNYLAHHYTRCNGLDCDRCRTCARYVFRHDMGRDTLIKDALCRRGNEAEFYIQVTK